MNESLKTINPIELNYSLTIIVRNIDFNKEFLADGINTVMLSEDDFLHFKDDGTVVRTTFYEPETWILRSNKSITAYQGNSFKVR